MDEARKQTGKKATWGGGRQATSREEGKEASWFVSILINSEPDTHLLPYYQEHTHTLTHTIISDIPV